MSEKLFGVNWDYKIGTNYFENPIYGKFWISKFAIRHLSDDPPKAYKILSLIHEYDKKTFKLDLVTKEEKNDLEYHSGLRTIEELLQEFPKTIQDKQDRVLELLFSINPKMGEYITITDASPYFFYTKSMQQLKFIIDIMCDKQLINSQYHTSNLLQDNTENKKILKLMIMEKGWSYLEEKQKHKNSKQAFIAMSFDPDKKEASIAISKAIEKTGFKPRIMNKKEHNKEISGDILYEIKRSNFLIADVTQQIPGVYLEAGYAMGLGIPVIWCCRKDDLDNVHFNTRQYNHVIWNNEKELSIKLKDRIRGTILL